VADESVEFLANYRSNTLYAHPAKNGAGAYATLVGDAEYVIGEISVGERAKIAVSAFYVREKADFDTLKITKLKYHKLRGWLQDGEIRVSRFQISQMQEFISLISRLDLQDAKKTKIKLDDAVNVGALSVLLSSSKGSSLIRELASNPNLHNDIYAVAAKRLALVEFENLLSDMTAEREWQQFFERNSWIFGHGLNYVSLDKVGDSLESTTTGSSFDTAGKRADGLISTRAAISQYVLVEIKRDSTDLLRTSEYRRGCWGVSDELSNAVTQTQKTVFEFSNNRFRDHLKNKDGSDSGRITYSVEPRSFLVIGNLHQLIGNDDKIACFELYRRNIRSPEIITFDELFYRARCIVENISKGNVPDVAEDDGAT
jgi:hypothetical protein